MKLRKQGRALSRSPSAVWPLAAESRQLGEKPPFVEFNHLPWAIVTLVIFV
jgi:hypothetical protein